MAGYWSLSKKKLNKKLDVIAGRGDMMPINSQLKWDNINLIMRRILVLFMSTQNVMCLNLCQSFSNQDYILKDD